MCMYVGFRELGRPFWAFWWLGGYRSGVIFVWDRIIWQWISAYFHPLNNRLHYVTRTVILSPDKDLSDTSLCMKPTIYVHV